MNTKTRLLVSSVNFCFHTKGEKIKSELSALVKDLPTVYDRVAESSKELQTAINYYQDFTHFITDR